MICVCNYCLCYNYIHLNYFIFLNFIMLLRKKKEWFKNKNRRRLSCSLNLLRFVTLRLRSVWQKLFTNHQLCFITDRNFYRITRKLSASNYRSGKYYKSSISFSFVNPHRFKIPSNVPLERSLWRGTRALNSPLRSLT